MTQPHIMSWDRLLNGQRLGKITSEHAKTERTPFQQDFDRIVFSSAFRRLQDKTQVFPLAQSDYVRTRLTHSLEASCVGRSLGNTIGQRLIDRDPSLKTCFHPSDLGAIVAAACLAHDIGNPPFGHAGEDAISHWFNHDPYGQEIIAQLEESGANTNDFLKFEGNAQGFRILTRLERPEDTGGMQLTCPTLAAFIKYPRPSQIPKHPAATVSNKKFGVMNDDLKLFQQVAQTVGLIQRSELFFARHPLTFLVEAADDICYHVIDIEDGYSLKLLDFNQTRDLLMAVVPNGIDEKRLQKLSDRPHSQIQYLRSKAIGSLIDQVADAFMDQVDAILAGRFDQSLTHIIPQREAFKNLITVAADHVYPAREVVLIEVAGYNVLGQLIEMFLRAINEKAEKPELKSSKWATIWKLFPQELIGYQHPADLSLHQRVLAVTDFVSSMTDRNAVALFKRLTGISLTGD